MGVRWVLDGCQMGVKCLIGCGEGDHPCIVSLVVRKHLPDRAHPILNQQHKKWEDRETWEAPTAAIKFTVTSVCGRKE